MYQASLHAKSLFLHMLTELLQKITSYQQHQKRNFRTSLLPPEPPEANN